MQPLFRNALLTAFCLLTCLTAFAQKGFTRLDNVPVNYQGKALRNPWAGGLNNPHFGQADLNNDGVQDLVVFDRNDNSVLTFLNGGTPGQVDYTYAPSFEQHFPKLDSWMKMRDINCDGVNDLLTSRNQNEAGVYTGSYTNGVLTFQQNGSLMEDALNGLSPLQVNPINIPAMKDINNDGDLDILTFDRIKNSFIEYYENQSMELTGTCGDSVLFKLTDDCWGNVFESGLNRKAAIRDTCGIIIPKTSGRAHAGASMIAFDENGDDVQDILLGSISFNTVTRLENIGNPDTAKIGTQDTLFPSYDQSIDINFFPAIFHLDVNNDDTDDLLVSTNSINGSRNFACVWHYENIGTMNNQVFDFRTDTFLVNEMLDFGEGSYPVFFDYNNDNLQDLIVGNFGYFSSSSSFKSSLALLENTGTATSPSFELVTRDYSGLRSLSIENMTPTFGDIDNDGQQEMITGKSDGKLLLFRNVGSPGNTNFTLFQAQYKNIDVGQSSAPLLYDANQDGLLDLIIGRKQGNLLYYENTGTASSPDFSSTPTNSNFGKVDVRQPGFIEGFSMPKITTLDDSTNQPYLLVGSKTGTVYLYEFDRDSLLSGSFPLKTKDMLDSDLGKRVAPAVAELSGDKKLEMAVGNYRGGLRMFTQSDSLNLSVTARKSALGFSVFPNPVSDELHIRLQDNQQNEEGFLRIINTKGQVFQEQRLLDREQRHQVQLSSSLPSGLYLIQLQIGNQTGIRKFIVK